MAGAGVAGQCPVELGARADAELGEHLLQVVLDSAATDEQPRADLGVRQALTGQPRNLRLLGSQLCTGLDRTLAGGFARGLQLTLGPLGKRLHAHRVEHVVGSAQLHARVAAAPFAAQPLPVKKMGSGKLSAHARMPQAVDRLTVQPIGGVAFAEQGADTSLDSQHPVSGREAGALGKPLQRRPDQRNVTRPGRCLGQFGDHEGPIPELIALECPQGSFARTFVVP